MASWPCTHRSGECSRQKLRAELTRVLSSRVTLSLPIVLQGGSGLEKQQLVRDVAADVGLRTTCVQCDAGSTPRMIMGLIVAGLQGQESHSVKKISLFNYIDELSKCCPPDATRRCIIIDNIEYVSMHTDMAGLVRGVSEWSDYPINAQFVLVSNLCWEPGMYDRALPTMAVFHFEQLSFDELQRILVDDPDLDVDDEARTIWTGTVKKYLPYCAIWSRDLKGVQLKLQEVQYTSLQLDASLLGEAELGQKLRQQSWQMHSACSSTDDSSELFVELRKQPTKEEVIERGVECILLLMAIYVAAWNSTTVDYDLMYSGSRVKRKKDAQGRAECRKAKRVLDVIAGGPHGVPRSRLFEYMLFLRKVTGHRLDEVNPDAAPAGPSADMDDEHLAPREVLENDQHIQQDLQWCVEHRLMAEEDREGKKIYHLWFREDLAVVLWNHLQHQLEDLMSFDNSLHNYLVYTK